MLELNQVKEVIWRGPLLHDGADGRGGRGVGLVGTAALTVFGPSHSERLGNLEQNSLGDVEFPDG